jgi:hypothetical protein
MRGGGIYIAASSILDMADNDTTDCSLTASTGSVPSLVITAGGAGIYFAGEGSISGGSSESNSIVITKGTTSLYTSVVRGSLFSTRSNLIIDISKFKGNPLNVPVGTTGVFSCEEPNYISGNCSSCSSGSHATLEQHCVYCANEPGSTLPAGSKTANPWNLKDIHGNVFEWCWDWCATYPESSQTDYVGPDSGTGRVVRGGGWDQYARLCRSALRSYNSLPSWRSNNLGFRLVRTVSEAPMTPTSTPTPTGTSSGATPAPLPLPATSPEGVTILITLLGGLLAVSLKKGD